MSIYTYEGVCISTNIWTNIYICIKSTLFLTQTYIEPFIKQKSVTASQSQNTTCFSFYRLYANFFELDNKSYNCGENGA